MARPQLRDRRALTRPMSTVSGTGSVARMLHISGVVQGVGFRPFVFRLARAHGLGGWVLNGDDGVRIHVEGAADAVDAFVLELQSSAPPAAQIATIDVAPTVTGAFTDFEIRDSDSERRLGKPHRRARGSTQT